MVLSTTRQRLLSAAALALLIAALAAMALHLLHPNNRIRYDEQVHHLPTILKFSEQWPRVQVRDYAVATTPGYHWLMAGLHQGLGLGETGLRAVNILLSMGMMGIIGWELSRRQSVGRAVLLGLPVVLSVYVVTSAGWLLPENLAWGLVAGILITALRPVSAGWFASLSAALLALVLVRQTHIWCAGVIVVAAAVDSQLRVRPRLAAGGFVATLPAAAVLAAFVIAWGGLVPPLFQPGGANYELSTQYGGWAPAAPAFALALIGAFGAPLLAWFWTAARQRAGRRFWQLLLCGAVVGLVVSLLPATDYHFPDRRSGLWRAVQFLPALGSHSPLIIALATAGGAIVALVLLALPRRDAAIFAATLIGFSLAQAANPMVWQRYYEPLILIWLLLAAARGSPDHVPPPRHRLLQAGGLFFLSAVQLATMAITLRGGE